MRSVQRKQSVARVELYLSGKKAENRQFFIAKYAKSAYNESSGDEISPEYNFRTTLEAKTMATSQGVLLKSLLGEFDLKPVHEATDFDRLTLTVEDVNRPGLQLLGFYDHFEPARLQVIGRVEEAYLQGLTPEERFVAFDRFFSYRIPALIVARGIDPPEECIVMARKHDITVLSTQETTSDIMSAMITTVKARLAPKITRHGVLVEVYGEGLLILGESGVGKSEAAIELIKRGHRLIADDAVEIQKVSNTNLIGSAPEVIRHYMELRGIGVINVAQLFGMGAVKDTCSIDMVISLEMWKDGVAYDRLGIDSPTTTILDVAVPYMVMPVKPGRNLAVIIEVAAMNNRQKRLGFNAALEFTEQINRRMDEAAKMQ